MGGGGEGEIAEKNRKSRFVEEVSVEEGQWSFSHPLLLFDFSIICEKRRDVDSCRVPEHILIQLRCLLFHVGDDVSGDIRFVLGY